MKTWQKKDAGELFSKSSLMFHIRTLCNVDIHAALSSTKSFKLIKLIENLSTYLLQYSKHSIVTDEMDNLKSTYYAGGKKCVNFTIQAYESLGRNIAVSILDLFGMNPASRIPNTLYQNLDGIRK